MEKQLQRLLNLLENTNIKNTRKRPNILYANAKEYTYYKDGKVKRINGIKKCKSMTFGVYKEMYKKNPGIKELKNNRKYDELYTMLKQTMQMYDAEFDFDCITLNKNVVTKPHQDFHNKGQSYILFLGDFVGGELLNEKGQVFKDKNTFYIFEGMIKHWNNKIIGGTKYSIIWFKRF